MLRRLAPALCAASLAVLATACTPVTAYQGYQAMDIRPADLKVGEDTKTTVRTKLGSPTSISTFEPNIWFYMAQTTDQFGAYFPRTRERSIVAITFNKTNEKVLSINSYTEKDGRVIAFNDRETPTVGKELSILEQLLSTIGTNLLPRNPEDDPGARPNQ
jgi:outer membrane protein assembly factor BamE (lipoprotein component of BamABCDE complex)